MTFINTENSNMAAKTEVLISPKAWQISSKFQRQTYVFDHGDLEESILGDSNSDRQPEMTTETGKMNQLVFNSSRNISFFPVLAAILLFPVVGRLRN